MTDAVQGCKAGADAVADVGHGRVNFFYITKPIPIPNNISESVGVAMPKSINTKKMLRQIFFRAGRRFRFRINFQNCLVLMPININKLIPIPMPMIYEKADPDPDFEAVAESYLGSRFRFQIIYQKLPGVDAKVNAG